MSAMTAIDASTWAPMVALVAISLFCLIVAVFEDMRARRRDLRSIRRLARTRRALRDRGRP